MTLLKKRIIKSWGVWKETASGAKDNRAKRKEILALAQARNIEIFAGHAAPGSTRHRCGLLSHDQQNSEPIVTSLLLDKFAAQPTAADDLKALRLSAHSSLHRLEQRLQRKQLEDSGSPKWL